ncbi:MAG: ABC transporter permease [Methylohalobius sp.]|nr:ABC transporter permease [Methylohalobius sp.]
MKDWVLAWRLLRRDLRAGEIWILVSALTLAVASVTAVVLLADRLGRTMTLKAADFLAADMVVKSSGPLPQEWQEEAQRWGLKTAHAVEFTSVLVENNQLLLVGVKAVSARYPLRGYLKTTLSDFAAAQITLTPPDPGRVWVAQRVLSQLGLKLGDRLRVGKAELVIDRVLTFEPDIRTDFYSLAPRVIMRSEDLPAAGVLTQGSRAHYYQLFAGRERELARFKRWLKPKLLPNQRLLEVQADRPDVARALNRAERYLGLSSIIVVLIAGVAIAMASRRYSERHFSATAVLKVLGASQGEVVRLYGYQFALIGVLAGGIGTGLGLTVQESLVLLLRSLLPEGLASPSWLALSLGPVIAWWLLLGFSLPPLLRLRRVPPAMALRGDLLPIPVSAWLVYGAAGGAIVLLLLYFTRDVELTGLIFGLGATALVILSGLTLFLLRLAKVGGERLGLAWRLGLNNLIRYRRSTLGQVLAFCLTLAAMTVSFLVRGDLIAAWQAQLPEDAPNHFVINIFLEELADFQTFITAELRAKTSRFFPIVRGRLVEVNGVNVHRLARKDSEGEMAINRDLSLTWTAELPPDNRLVAGTWWYPEKGGRRVSVEQGLARSLGIRLGDRLGFVVEGQKIEAQVVSLRTVQWDSMLPNFYMIFAPGDLDGFATTYLASFYLAPEYKAKLAELVKRFPNITLVEVDMILEHFRLILRQVSFAVDYVLVLALLAGLLVLLAALRSSLDERLYQGAVLRVLGAKQKLLRSSQWIEFVLLGWLAGALAVAMSEAAAWVLYVRIFDIPFVWHPWIWGVVPALGGGLIGLAGVLGTRRVLRQSPARLLRTLGSNSFE